MPTAAPQTKPRAFLGMAAIPEDGFVVDVDVVVLESAQAEEMKTELANDTAKQEIRVLSIKVLMWRRGQLVE
jgi:hypothetical protein